MQKEIEKMSWYVLRVMGGKEKKTVSFIEKDNCPSIINMIPNAPTEKIYLRFILKKNN